MNPTVLSLAWRFRKELGIITVVALFAFSLAKHSYQYGVNTERAKLARQVEINTKAAAEAVTKSKNEVSHARKTVDDSYRAGAVPERVRRFYIDAPMPGMPPSVQ